MKRRFKIMVNGRFIALRADITATRRIIKRFDLNEDCFLIEKVA